jgi:hypothetical protein
MLEARMSRREEVAEMDADDILASDEDRERALETLKTARTEGRLTLEEFGERVDLVMRGRTQTEIARGLTGIPRTASTALVERPRPRWIVGLWRGAEHRGGWQSQKTTNVVAAWSPCVLDLRAARLEGDVMHINAVALWSSVRLVVPKGVRVEVHNPAMLHDRRNLSGNGEVLPGAPTIQLRAVGLWNDVVLTDEGR